MSRIKILLFTLIFAFLCFTSAHSQFESRGWTGSLRGRVSAANPNHALRVVTVSLRSIFRSLYFTSMTDSFGNFEFRDLPNGSYTLSVSASGYEETQMTINLGETCKTCIVEVMIHSASAKEVPPKGTPKIISIEELKRKIPGKALKAFEKAETRLKKGDEKEAIKLLHKAITIFPDYPEAYTRLGYLYLKANNLVEARRALEKASELGSTDPSTYSYLGIIYYDRNENAKAIEVLKRAIEYDSQSAVNFLYLGGAYYRGRLYDEATENLRRALQIDPQKASQAHLQLANVYTQQSHYDEAVSELRQYLSGDLDGLMAKEVKQNITILETRMITSSSKNK